jgi:hypothetical protein
VTDIVNAITIEPYLCNVDEAYCGWDLVPCDFAAAVE